MALPTTDAEWFTRLSAVHDKEKPELKALDDEYELRSPRAYMHPELTAELGDRIQQVVIAWPMLVVDALEERLDVEGFRLPDEDSADDDLWRVWQENGCDEGSQLGHVDALTMRRGYIAVGSNEEDDATPIVTYESPLEVYADIDPRTRKGRAALRRWVDEEASILRTSTSYSTLYLPNATVFSEGTGWKETGRDDHNLGELPIVPIVNRARLSDQRGRSELTPILPLAHAANKLATDMMVAAEFVALPLRGIFGIGPDDLEDAAGNKVTALQAILGRLLTLPVLEGREFEFAAADLSNFHKSINQLAQLVASLAGLPPHYLGMATDNPPSADAIRSNEARLVKRAERRQRAFGGGHEQSMRLVRRIQSGEWDPRMRRLETIWRDASTPTIAQKADAALKLYTTQPRPVVPLRQTREDLGYSQGQIARMEADDEQEAARSPLAEIARGLSEPLPVGAGAGAGA